MSIIVWGYAHYYGVLVMVFLAMACVLWYRVNKTEHVVRTLTGTWTSLSILNFSRVRLWCKAGLIATGLLFLCIALLRPHGQAYEQKIAQHGRDVYFILDISRSMLAGDVKPNRLACAKEKIKKTISLLDCERVGLILFSGSAFIQCPLTTDITTFLLFLDSVDVEMIASGTTALDGALTKALDALGRTPDRKNKLVIVVTDGEDFSTGLTDVKERAREQRLYIFALGIGSGAGAPIPLFDQQGNPAGHQRDDQGNVVITQLNEIILKELVKDIGGDYIRMTNDDSDVDMLVRKVRSFEKEELGDAIIKQYNEYFPYFVVVSFMCFIIEWVL